MNGLSFIIASLGKSDKLEQLINQIDSMFSNKEIILVDNSSNKKLYKKYSSNKKCKYIHENRLGSSFARNAGAKIAKYNLLIFMDDDIIIDSSFKNVDLKKINEDASFGIGGGKIIVNNIPKYLPHKYTYLAGEKNYGNKVLELPKYKYLGGCILIIKKKVFNEVNGFDIEFGHSGNNLGANEDVIIQELIRKKGYKVKYLPNIIVYHFWNEDESIALNRIKKQGIADRMTDRKYFKTRMILKLIKYKFFIFINSNKKELSKEKLYDLERYKSYVKNQ